MGNSRVVPVYVEYDGQSSGEWYRRKNQWGQHDGPINAKNVHDRVQAFVNSQKPGGVNAHLVKADGQPSRPNLVTVKVQSGKDAGDVHRFRIIYADQVQLGDRFEVVEVHPVKEAA